MTDSATDATVAPAAPHVIDPEMEAVAATDASIRERSAAQGNMAAAALDRRLAAQAAAAPTPEVAQSLEVVGPTAPVAQAPLENPGLNATPGGDKREATAAVSAAEEAPVPADAPGVDTILAGPQVRNSRGARDLLRAVALGLALAAAIIGLAILFRPAPAAPGGDVPTMLGSAPIPAPATVAPVSQTPAPEIAVRLRVGPGLSDARRDALRGAIVDAGFAAPEFLAIPFPVERGRVVYFDTADRAAAETVARRLAPLVPTPVDVRDLGATAAGKFNLIEVWIAN